MILEYTTQPLPPRLARGKRLRSLSVWLAIMSVAGLIFAWLVLPQSIARAACCVVAAIALAGFVIDCVVVFRFRLRVPGFVAGLRYIDMPVTPNLAVAVIAVASVWR